MLARGERLLVGEFCIVRIQELSLFNYRRFENKKFTLNPGMNVFVGKKWIWKDICIRGCKCDARSVSCSIQNICSVPVCI